MSEPAVSVIVVSNGRAADLPLCLLGVSQLDYPAFEVVLVADADGIEAARTLPFFDDLKFRRFDEANISAARNLGIAEAAGEIIMFIDDDAVPEPTWLRYLVAGFSEPEVAAAGGFVIGRNGISFQWKARSVDYTGVATPLDVDEENPTVLTPKDGRAIKTEGTNMALRREVIADMGGFDPAFRFYLDETDVNYRLMKAGHQTAITPLAQVHHGYKASAQRRADRVPVDLRQIGASLAVFLRKHAPEECRADAIAAVRNEQKTRALHHMVQGGLEPRDVQLLMQSFESGLEEGMQRSLERLEPLGASRSAFKPMPSRISGHAALVGSHRLAEPLREKARQIVRSGRRVSLFLYSKTARPHRVRFSSDGFWEQSGGQFGRSVRVGRRFIPANRAKRHKLELKRLARVRDIDPDMR